MLQFLKALTLSSPDQMRLALIKNHFAFNHSSELTICTIEVLADVCDSFGMTHF